MRSVITRTRVLTGTSGYRSVLRMSAGGDVNDPADQSPELFKNSDDVLVQEDLADNDNSEENGDPSRSISLVIVDDHDVVVLGLSALLHDVREIETVDSAGNVADALEIVARHEPDVVLMDYRLPDGSGIDCTRSLRESHPNINIVMITSSSDRNVLSKALDAGCCGFLSKDANRDDLVAAIIAASTGDSYFTHDMLKHLVHLRRYDEAEDVELTSREVDILQFVAQGLFPEEIAERLILSPHTVKNHFRRAMSKLDAHTKLDAVVSALRARIISIDE